MIRIVVGRSGHQFIVYRGDRRLGDIERFFDGAGGSAWRWQAGGRRGEERTLGASLDAIERACGSGIAPNDGVTAGSSRPNAKRSAGARH
jgi:hypothetical protein